MEKSDQIRNKNFKSKPLKQKQKNKGRLQQLPKQKYRQQYWMDDEDEDDFRPVRLPIRKKGKLREEEE